nr:unnamed protein product [Callosobruchus analis]
MIKIILLTNVAYFVDLTNFWLSSMQL